MSYTYDRYGYIQAEQTGERYILMASGEKYGTHELKKPLKWSDPITGVTVIKSRTGLRYTVKNRYGTAIYTLKGADRAERNAFVDRMLAGVNQVLDIPSYADREEE